MRLATLLTVVYIRMGFRRECHQIMCYLVRVGVLMSVGLRLAPVQDDDIPNGTGRDDLERAWQFVFGVIGCIRRRLSGLADHSWPVLPAPRSPCVGGRVFGEQTSLLTLEEEVLCEDLLNRQYPAGPGKAAQYLRVMRAEWASLYPVEEWHKAQRNPLRPRMSQVDKEWCDAFFGDGGDEAVQVVRTRLEANGFFGVL